ncbi:MAG: undecaprenyl-phosphate glucose phosphotransferase [Nitrospinae bacterium]|nr:undecaprenyl-phosphate glucose phosphotransferase [Nitrospinota bacterium]
MAGPDKEYHVVLRRYGQLNAIFLFGGDVIALISAWFMAYWLRFVAEIVPVSSGYPDFNVYLVSLFVVLLIWLIASSITRLYHYLSGLNHTREVIRLTSTLAWTVLLFAFFTFFYRKQSYSRLLVVLFMMLGPVFLFIVRRLVWSFIRRLRRLGVDMRRILIAGTTPLARRVATHLEAYRTLGFQIVGHLCEGGEAADVRVLGRLEEVREVVEREKIHEIYLALPPNSRAAQEELLNALADSSVDIRLVPDIVEHMRLNAGIEELDGLPVILLSQTPLLGWNRWMKVAVDYFLGTLALLVFSPLMVVIALVVKWTSRGPVLYHQERMGLDGVQFRMYKFRSMRIDAEAELGEVWTKKDDERCTRFGAYLRKTSLDELPQLFNVLRGEMSLVGPRPERPVFVEKFRTSVPDYMLRHKMKSGITGWAQVNGWRGNTSIEKRIEFDLHYIENWSMGFDFKILWLTLWKGLINNNAY